MITKKIIVGKLLAYLQDENSFAALVAWAEQALLESGFKDNSSHTIRNILAKLGMADVKAFGLDGKTVKALWKD